MMIQVIKKVKSKNLLLIKLYHKNINPTNKIQKHINKNKSRKAGTELNIKQAAAPTASILITYNDRADAVLIRTVGSGSCARALMTVTDGILIMLLILLKDGAVGNARRYL